MLKPPLFHTVHPRILQRYFLRVRISDFGPPTGFYLRTALLPPCCHRFRPVPAMQIPGYCSSVSLLASQPAPDHSCPSSWWFLLSFWSKKPGEPHLPPFLPASSQTQLSSVYMSVCLFCGRSGDLFHLQKYVVSEILSWSKPAPKH